MNKSFGQSLRELRRSKNVTQRELAKKVSVDFSYISKLENDRMPPPAADTIVKICNVLGIPSEELLALTGKIPSDVKNAINSNQAALKFLREANSIELSESEWIQLTKHIKSLRDK